jgi:hypothetical protein
VAGVIANGVNVVPTLVSAYDQANAAFDKANTAGGSGSANIAILDEGVYLTNTVSSINFVGSTVTTSNVGNNVTVTITSLPRVVTIADGTSITIDGDTTDIAVQTNTQTAGTLTINAPSGTPAAGQKIILRLQSTNIQTFSWNSVFDGSTDTPLPTASTGSSKYDYMGFIYNSISLKWDLIARNFGY